MGAPEIFQAAKMYQKQEKTMGIKVRKSKKVKIRAKKRREVRNAGKEQNEQENGKAKREKEEKIKARKVGTLPNRKNRWMDEYYAEIYDWAKTGLTDRKIAQAIGVPPTTYQKWKETKPLLRLMLAQARKPREIAVAAETYQEFIYKRLPENLKELWKEIEACEDAPSNEQKVEAMLRQAGKRARQHLFVYALPACNFNATEACRKVSVPRTTLQTWIETDPKFAAILQEINVAKKDFFESKLVELVADKNPAATLFVNKTVNRDRGYAEKVTHEVTGKVEHTHTVINLEELSLPIEVRKAILEAYRKAEQKKLEGPQQEEEKEPRREFRYTLPEFAGKDPNYVPVIGDSVIEAEFEKVVDQDDDELEQEEDEEAA